MSVDSVPDSKPGKKKQKSRKSQLRVVFDTNALYVAPNSLGSASDLVRSEIVVLISESRYPDLEILWYLPEVVRHERQYQMQTEALKLRPAITKVERLLDHNLALTDQVLLDRVRAKIDEKEGELGLQEIKLDHTKVDWPRVVQASVYRRPPFDPGEKEKGFRDALIAESFLQLLEVSPKTPSVCRLVFVTNDQLLSEAVRERIAGLANASVLSGIEELKGLINSVVSNVAEDFIALLKPKAAKMFFVSSDDKDALYYKGEVGEQIRNRFKVQLEAKPEGATFRKNGTWYISAPNFSRKEGRRVFWASRVEVEVEAGNVVKAGQGQYPQIGLTTTLSQLAAPKPQEATGLAKYIDELANPPSFNVGSSWKDLLSQWADSPDTKVVTHKGKDVFEVLWSAEVTMAKDLKKGAVEDIKHVGLGCQAVV